MGVEMIRQWEQQQQQQQQQQVTFIQRCSLISDHCAVHWNYLLSVLWLKTNNSYWTQFISNVYEHDSKSHKKYWTEIRKERKEKEKTKEKNTHKKTNSPYKKTKA